MATIREIQLCELEMLREIDRIATKYNLKYAMAYGTLLGAVRHKGFIPWDDDMDISMPLSDFKKFEKICKKELDSRFFLQTPRTDIAPFSFYKMRANNTVMVETGLKDLKMHHGIWLDIFPYVYASKSKLGRKIQLCCLGNINHIRARFFYKNSKKIFRRIFARIPKWCGALLDNSNLMLMKILGSKHSGMYIEMARYKFKEEAFIPIELLEKTHKVEFENYYFSAPVESVKYLVRSYGEDYMTPVRYSHIADYESVKIL